MAAAWPANTDLVQPRGLDRRSVDRVLEGGMSECFKQVEGLELTPVDDGFIIYEAERDRVHYLNHTSALVLTLCDGHNSEADIKQLLQRQFDLSVPPDEDVDRILAQFRDEGLVTPTEPALLPP